ncbi:MAG: hypothetical protein IJ906_16250 [Oscillospiraceae bacterium]|nr:hypothetical protein [Oscillospiraceae bacterium]
MNELLNMLQNMRAHQSPIPGILGFPNIRFRDVLQLLLLSVAVRIVSRAYEIMNRMGCFNALPMQTPPQPQPLLMQFPQMPAPERKDT